MAILTKDKVQKILLDRLHLRDAEFRLQKTDGRIDGNVISSTFKGKGDHRRQEMIWKALEAELGEHASRQVGLLLAYTPDEWNIGREMAQAFKKAKKAG